MDISICKVVGEAAQDTFVEMEPKKLDAYIIIKNFPRRYDLFFKLFKYKKDFSCYVFLRLNYWNLLETLKS